MAVLRAGGLVGFPTETVYGLGADAANERAVARLFAAKGRPRFNPLIAHVDTAEAAAGLGLMGRRARLLAAAFWPGPLTLVVPVQVGGAVCELARAGLSTVALRVPSHPVARGLLQAFGGAVVAPSANRSGHVSPTTAAHVLEDLGERVDAVLDGGATPLGIESTIIACVGGPARLLRPGGVPRGEIERVLGEKVAPPELRPVDGASGDGPLAPGQLASHYAPRARLRLNASALEPGEALLDFGASGIGAGHPEASRLDLSPSGDLVEAAANLYAHLRALDRSGAASIAVAPIPAAGLGEAIHDRLRRAAAPR
ncbi:TsaC protein required for threonylcarbamoyladenosine t(6)A37 modification in tRNA [Blastochloris viridis]|uniref:Threonylcarbamoyl-AMP synthase n=1 Tax=Blastochloris viridis TaxID=1079 RepID=A0A182D134_BLAVI|nr:TsaC protein required for threonylcarbamoyladenosine t(6)A37 modification in tRNA [Blastochloris viridis]